MPDLSASSLELTGANVSVADPPVPGPRSAAQVVSWILALAIVSVAVASVGRLARNEALTLIGGYGALLFGVGAAPFQWRADLGLLTRTAGSVVVGFSVLMIGGALMADLHGFWHPIPAAVIVAVIAAALHAVGVRRAWSGQLLMRGEEPSVRTAWRQRGLDNRWSLALTVLGAALCLGRAAMVSDPAPASWGFLPAVGPLWFVGFGLILVGFAVGYRDGLSAGAAVVAVALATTLTPALVYDAPRSATAEKQMWLTQHVIQYHYISVTAGIYPAYSALFAGIAWFCVTLGIHGMLGRNSLFGLAAYWPVVMALGRVAVLRLMMQTVAATTARRWTAVMLVLLTDSISDANYFSPQSIAYVIGIGAIAFALRGRIQRQFGTKWTLALLILAGAALAPTHEISPFMVAGALVLLCIFQQAPWWGWLTVSVPAIAWVALVHKAVAGYFSFGALFDITNFAPPKTYATPGLSRMPIIGYQSHALLLDLVILIGLAAVGFVPNLRRGWSWGYWLSAGTGVGVIAVNPYGNEGIFRAALFGIPWLAALASRMPLPRFGARSPRTAQWWRGTATVAVLATCVVLGGLFLVASYSLDSFNVLRTADVAEHSYLDARDARPSFILGIESSGDGGDVLGAYAKFTVVDWDAVANKQAFDTLHPTANTLRLLTRSYRRDVRLNGGPAADPLYIDWSHSLLPFLAGYGLASSSQMYDWLALLKHSSEWQLAFDRGGHFLFRLRNTPDKRKA